MARQRVRPQVWALGRAWGRPLRHRSLHAAALLFRRQRDHGAGDAGDRLDDTLGGGAQRLHLLGTGSRHGDRKEHLGIGNENLGNHAEVDDVAGEVRSVDRLQALDDDFLGDVFLDGGHQLFLCFCA